ncbi:transcription intermediary factor 1-alpha-like [Metopolophium dirhodum]|uniref:transcription intermediary factor 1-alpha-like n=1 Tax=Metopolophium dirhodum TaxID=44670 RepID=UPI00298F9015|nr:transcription intermediary factor 1-alpha-like [Metopolophium dirhodum]
MQLTGDPKMLSCLHFVCKDCIGKENSVSGVECKCLTVTKGKLIDYPIESSNISINKDHNPNAIMTYPMLEEFPVCPCCTDTYADVYCIECSILLCQFCHLHSHHNHNYKVLEKFRKEINSNMLLEKFKLESNNKNLDLSLKETENQIRNLEIKNRAIHEEIDKETEMLHEEINRRALEIKYLVDNCLLDTIGETYKNKHTLKNLQNKNKYYIEIAKSVLSHNNQSDIFNVSRLVLTQLENVNNIAINITEVTSKLEVDLQNNFYETMDNCISTIKEIGNIIASPVFSLSKTNTINTSSNVGQTTVNLQTQSVHPKSKFPFQSLEEDEVNTSGYFNMDTENVDSEPFNYVECSCCRQLAEQLVKCVNCKRSYHNHCHMPLIPENVIHERTPFSFWRCTMCEYPKMFSKVLEDLKSTTYSVSIGEPGRKIIERILMELFCQNGDSVNFRDCPNKRICPSYYEKISNPITLNIIKNHLETNTYYTTLGHIINDLKQVFLNALMFYHPSDGYYDSACRLLTSLNTMIDSWIPELNTKRK